MSVKIEPFVQAVEVWTPEGGKLRFRSGAYGRHDEFASASEGMTFARGEGLPGAAWQAGKPVLWDKLDTRFVRRDAAAGAGFDAGVAFPVLHGDQVVAVVSMLCGSRALTGGCIELWEPNELRELYLSAGYYGKLDAFADISRLLRFQRGRGLPGIAWERGLPHIIPDLKAAGSFVRAAAAKTSGVEAGLGIPLYQQGEVAQLLLLLSAQHTPLARAFEVWTVEDEILGLSEYYYASELGLGVSLGQRPAQPPGEGLALSVRDSKLPVASHAPSATRASFQLGLGIPVYERDRLRAIVNILN
jgi:hypothetical protein